MPEQAEKSDLRRAVRRALKPTIDNIVDDVIDWVKASLAATNADYDEATQTAWRREASARSEALRGQLIDAEVLGEVREAVDRLIDRAAEASASSQAIPVKKGRERAA